MKYHYSPVTKKEEKCSAQVSCPYKESPHGTKEEIKEYARKNNKSEHGLLANSNEDCNDPNNVNNPDNYNFMRASEHKLGEDGYYYTYMGVYHNQLGDFTVAIRCKKTKRDLDKLDPSGGPWDFLQKSEKDKLNDEQIEFVKNNEEILLGRKPHNQTKQEVIFTSKEDEIKHEATNLIKKKIDGMFHKRGPRKGLLKNNLDYTYNAHNMVREILEFGNYIPFSSGSAGKTYSFDDVMSCSYNKSLYDSFIKKAEKKINNEKED